MAYRNPILPGFNPDPSICRAGPDYFLATSTFEFFPGVPIYTSKDLINWRLIGHALNRRSQLDLRAAESGAGIFAPALRYHKGRWYMTVTSFSRRSPAVQGDARINSRGFFVSTDDIWDDTKWTDPSYFDATGIDQDLFFDDDGKTYLTWAKNIPELDPMPPKHYNLSCFSMEVDIETGRSLSPVHLVRHQDTVGNWVSEGPHIFKRGELYYLLTADGGTHTAHQEWVCRSTKGPFGPWEEGPASVNPVIFNDDDPDVRQTGHMDMVDGTDGRWWAVCLAVRPQNGLESQLGRETFLMPMEWVDDWPVVNDRKRISIHGSDLAKLERSPSQVTWKADFQPHMNLGRSGWYHLRTPVRPDYDLTSRPGQLGITGGPFNLDEDESLSMVLRKQTTFNGRWRATVSFEPGGAGEAAGVGVWWSKWANATLFIRRAADGQRDLVFRHVEPEATSFTEDILPCPNGPITVIIDTSNEEYEFSISASPNGEATRIGSISSRSLTHRWPLSSPFTGTHFILFAHGVAGVGCRQQAWFSDVSWEGTREGGE